MRRSETFCAIESGTHSPRPLLPVWLEVTRFGGQERVYGPGRLSGMGRPMNRIRPVNRLLILVVSTLLVVVGASAAGLAAPITGSNQAEPASESGRPPFSGPGAPAVVGDPDATVIEFSVGPSASDPNKMETIIKVQQKGGRSICVNQSTSDIISRSYRKRGDEPFAPAVPTEIRGLTSGDSGDLVGFNDIRVFIRPHGPEDEFTNLDECFVAAEAEACFVADEEDCDQPLEEGDFVCVGDSISSSGCPALDHANLMRQLRIMLALNAPPGQIITAAGIAGAPELALPSGEPEAPGGGPPAGDEPAGPTDGTDFSGSGGGPNLIAVPDLFDLTREDAEDAITDAGLRVGTIDTVATAGQQTRSLMARSLMGTIVRSANAQGPPSVTRVISQFPLAFTPVLPLTFVNFVLSAPAAIPEPSTLALFAMGLGLLILITWWQRRRLS